MIIQVSPASTPGLSLLTENSTPTTTPSFDRYLEEEQKRLVLAFAGLGRFDFSGFFNYPSGSWPTETNAQPLRLFSDHDVSTTTSQSDGQTSRAQTTADQPTAVETSTSLSAFSRSVQKAMQDILIKTGWLVPNLASQPLLAQAQLAGKLLNRLDLQALVDEILSQLKIVQDKGQVELNLSLKPADLGEILLTLTSSAGAVTINIQAGPEAKKLLAEQRLELERALKKSQINLTAINITEIKEATKDA